MKDDLGLYFGIILILGALMVGVSQPYFEAKAFNKFSDTKATYWDAMWTKLRVTSK